MNHSENKNFQIKECIICMENIEEKNKIILPCGHEYHATCFCENIVKNNNKCPMCRIEICSETLKMPNLTKTISATIMEQMLNTKDAKDTIKTFIKMFCKNANISHEISDENKIKMCNQVINILLSFGFNYGKIIDDWIKDGNNRYQQEYNSDYSIINVNVNEIIETL